MIITDFDSTLEREGWVWMSYDLDGFRCADGSDSAEAIVLRDPYGDRDVLRFDLLDGVWTITWSDTHDLSLFDPTAFRDPTDFPVVPLLAR